MEKALKDEQELTEFLLSQNRAFAVPAALHNALGSGREDVARGIINADLRLNDSKGRFSRDTSGVSCDADIAFKSTAAAPQARQPETILHVINRFAAADLLDLVRERLPEQHVRDMVAARALAKGQQPLHELARRAGLEPLAKVLRCANALFELGANADARCAAQAKTILHWLADGLDMVSEQHDSSTCDAGALGLARLLLARGADARAVDSSRCTALHACVKAGPAAISLGMELLDHAPDVVDVCDRVGRTALHVAAARGDARWTKALLSRGASFGARDGAMATPLCLAAEHGDVETAQVLIGAGADVHVVRGDGQTPLHAAVKQQSDALARVLLEAAADRAKEAANSPRVDRRVPLHRAAHAGSEACVALLLSFEADPTAMDNTRKTPAAVAHMMGYTSIAAALEEAKARWDTGKHGAKRAADTGLQTAKLRRDSKRVRFQVGSAC